MAFRTAQMAARKRIASISSSSSGSPPARCGRESAPAHRRRLQRADCMQPRHRGFSAVQPFDGRRVRTAPAGPGRDIVKKPVVVRRKKADDHRHMHRLIASGGFVLALWLMGPATAFAQSQITGQVKDESGAVLPGVTVEAASPVLIEKVKTAVTDDQGRYTIVALRPGAYKITFTLTGFSSVVRDGVDLPANFVAS